MTAVVLRLVVAALIASACVCIFYFGALEPNRGPLAQTDLSPSTLVVELTPAKGWVSTPLPIVTVERSFQRGGDQSIIIRLGPASGAQPFVRARVGWSRASGELPAVPSWVCSTAPVEGNAAGQREFAWHRVSASSANALLVQSTGSIDGPGASVPAASRATDAQEWPDTGATLASTQLACWSSLPEQQGSSSSVALVPAQVVVGITGRDDGGSSVLVDQKTSLQVPATWALESGTVDPLASSVGGEDGSTTSLPARIATRSLIFEDSRRHRSDELGFAMGTLFFGAGIGLVLTLVGEWLG